MNACLHRIALDKIKHSFRSLTVMHIRLSGFRILSTMLFPVFDTMLMPAFIIRVYRIDNRRKLG